MKRPGSLLMGVVLVLMASGALAQVPQLLNYQGRLTDPSGNPQNGTFTMQFALYDAQSGGNQLPSGSPWSETQSVTVTNGVFNVLLGSVTALPATLFQGGPTDTSGPLRFLQVTVSGEVLTPRKRIASAAYAVNTGYTLNQFPAAEAITTGDAVAAGYYQNDGGVLLDSSTKGTGSGTSMGASISVANNPNRIVIVFIAINSNNSNGITNVSIGGVAATQIDYTGAASLSNYSYCGAWYVLNPTAGSVPLMASFNPSIGYVYTAYSYYNVAQTSTIPTHSIAISYTKSNETSNITPGELGDMVMGYIWGMPSGGGTLSYTLTGLPNNNQIDGLLSSGDNGQAVTPLTQAILFTVSGTATTSNIIYGTFSLKPAATAYLGYVIRASAAATSAYITPTSLPIRSSAFLGFALSGGSAGANIPVVTSGNAPGQSGLYPFMPYYLSDSYGQIATTPGTISRKIGIATTPTALTITNIW